MKIDRLFAAFFDSEKSGGLILIGCTFLSVALANSAFGTAYHHFWSVSVGGLSLEHWVNDGLMSIFFLLIGLELKRELFEGELSTFKKALLPVFAAIGGMIVPAALYLLVNSGTSTQGGAGIPMATDIAFALGILSLLGNKVPASLKIFLTALAVIDDLGAIIIIAVFYTKTILWINLVAVLSLTILLYIFNRLKVKSLYPYLFGGIAMWYFMLHSGIHATITGILVAFVMPFGKAGQKSPSSVLQHFLHKPVAFIILPVFAFANTAIILHPGIVQSITQTYSYGIALGLISGKPLGIFFLTFFAVAMRLCKLPQGLRWPAIIGVGFLGGIGFTMSIFITLLAFGDESIINNAKFAILLSSFTAGIAGYLVLQATLRKPLISQQESTTS